jgi:hypothetical protein
MTSPNEHTTVHMHRPSIQALQNFALGRATLYWGKEREFELSFNLKPCQARIMLHSARQAGSGSTMRPTWPFPRFLLRYSKSVR